MLGQTNLKKGLILALLIGLILTRLFPFFFGSQIYSQSGWRFLAPSSLVLGPGSMVTTLDKILSLCIDTLVFAAVAFVAWQGLG
jgi:hypothetical protein